jgi:pantoate kinase
MVKKKNQLIIRVPHRISGFFEIVDEQNGKKIMNPERIGSKGAGFNVAAFGYTKITFLDNRGKKESEDVIKINGDKYNDKAETSHFILSYFKKLIKKDCAVNIQHNFDLPVGCGFGASGSGALGLVYGLDGLFDLGLSELEKGKIAHIAEVINKTGLGTICGQLAGGLCLLDKAGYPCSFKKITVPKDIKIVCGTFGEIPTKSILSDPILSDKIKKAGKSALMRLEENPNLKTFIQESIKFVKKTEILELLNLYEIKELIKILNQENIIGASMNQLGRSVYAFCKEHDVENVIEIFNSFYPKPKVYTTEIYNGKTLESLR